MEVWEVALEDCWSQHGLVVVFKVDTRDGLLPVPCNGRGDLSPPPTVHKKRFEEQAAGISQKFKLDWIPGTKRTKVGPCD